MRLNNLIALHLSIYNLDFGFLIPFWVQEMVHEGLHITESWMAWSWQRLYFNKVRQKIEKTGIARIRILTNFKKTLKDDVFIIFREAKIWLRPASERDNFIVLLSHHTRWIVWPDRQSTQISLLALKWAMQSLLRHSQRQFSLAHINLSQFMSNQVGQQWKLSC